MTLQKIRQKVERSIMRSHEEDRAVPPAEPTRIGTGGWHEGIRIGEVMSVEGTDTQFVGQFYKMGDTLSGTDVDITCNVTDMPVLQIGQEFAAVYKNPSPPGHRRTVTRNQISYQFLNHAQICVKSRGVLVIYNSRGAVYRTPTRVQDAGQGLSRRRPRTYAKGEIANGKSKRRTLQGTCLPAGTARARTASRRGGIQSEIRVPNFAIESIRPRPGEPPDTNQTTPAIGSGPIRTI